MAILSPVFLETLICILKPPDCLKGGGCVCVCVRVCARAHVRALNFPSCGNGSRVFIAGSTGPFSRG